VRTITRWRLCSALFFGAVAAGVWMGPTREASAQARAAENGRLEELSLAVGETRTVSARDIRNYSLSLTDVVDTRLTPDNGQFVIVGKRPGSTSLLLIKNDGTQTTYEITVTPRPLADVERELQQLLDGVTGVRYRRIGNRFFLEGSVATEAELRRIQQLAALYPGQVENLVTVGGGSAGDRKLLVRVDVFFVQYDTNSSYAVGLAWPASVGGASVVQSNLTYDFVARTTTTAQASVVNQPLPSLDIASQRGWAKVLRQASLLAANGTEATFDSGGEQNFTANTGLTVGIQKITFGTNVTVLPRFDSKTGQIDVKLVSDISDLTAAASGNLPGRTYSRLTTNVTLKLGQALVLSGLHSQTKTHAVAGLPLLSNIPVLGLLFGSHRESELTTENAMFIIPSVVEAISPSQQSMIGSALKEYRNFSGDLRQVTPHYAVPPSQP
jgi:pilus assembly protein CpaC